MKHIYLVVLIENNIKVQLDLLHNLMVQHESKLCVLDGKLGDCSKPTISVALTNHGPVIHNQTAAVFFFKSLLMY